MKRQQWARQVSRTRQDWDGPTNYTHVCSIHFSPECFEKGPQLKAQLLHLTTPVKLVLTKDAEPTLFTRQQDISPSGPSKVRDAFRKREKKRVSYLS